MDRTGIYSARRFLAESWRKDASPALPPRPEAAAVLHDRAEELLRGGTAEAGLLLGCLISAGFLRLVLGAVFFAVGVLLLFR